MLLSFDRVTKTYRRGRHEILVLDDISFDLAPGEFAAIHGQRAAGKTTLLRLAAGLDVPDSGAVQLDGRDISPRGRGLRLGGLPDGIGWMRRTGPLTGSTTMLDHVVMPLLQRVPHAVAEVRAGRALKEMAVAHLSETVWSEMSEAERMRTALAQAMVCDPQLLLADDPTAGLDATEREIVLGLLRNVAEKRNMAILMSVPEVPDTLRAHRLMSLSDGKLREPSAARGPGEVIDFRRA